jgi:hypothetical protein
VLLHEIVCKRTSTPCKMVSLYTTRTHAHVFGPPKVVKWPHAFEFEAVVRKGEQGAAAHIQHLLVTINNDRTSTKAKQFMSCVLDSPTSSPLSRTTKELPAIEKPLPNPSLQLQRRLTDDEGTPFPPRTISRSFRPPSLHLKTSNGSTAASIISSSSSVSLLSTLTPDSTSSNYTLKSSLQQLHKRTPSQLSKELLPTTTYSPHDRPLPLLPQNKQQQQQSLIHPALRDTTPFTQNDLASPLCAVPSDDNPALADDEANMKRLRNLVIKRKPIKGEDPAIEKGASLLPVSHCHGGSSGLSVVSEQQRDSPSYH